MAMTVKRAKGVDIPKVFMHKVADIRGGVSVNTKELGGDYLREGAVLTAPDNGVCHVVKVAVVVDQVEASGVTLKVKKMHNFKTGDAVLLKEGSVAVKVKSIDASSSKDTDMITLEATLGAIPAGSAIAEAKEASASASKLKYKPFSVAGTGKVFDGRTNVDTDAWVIGVTCKNVMPECVAKHLAGIINY